MKSYRQTSLCLLTLGLVMNFPSYAQDSGGACRVSEFRSLALLTHDVSERISKINEWLVKKGPKCTPGQLAAIASNRSNWLGTADTANISAGIDGLIEAKISNQSDQLASMYSSKGKEGRSSVEVTKPPPAPAPVVPPPAPVQVNGGVSLVQPVVVLPPDKPKEPEVADERFSARQRREIQNYFEENRGTGECPRGMIERGEKCASLVTIRPWKPGQPLPVSVRTEELPLPLFYKLGPPPAEHQYKKVSSDILMLKGPQQIVTDAVLDLGGIEPKKPPKDAPAEPPKRSPPVKTPRDAS